jgi:cysteine synthase
MLGAARGFLVKLCVPANVTPERRQMLQSYGAEVVLTDPMEGSDGAIQEARRIFAEDPGATSIRTSTATTPTGARTSTRPGWRSSSRPADS